MPPPSIRRFSPEIQGGPHNHTTAGIAVALKEAAAPEFTGYAHQVVANAQALAKTLSAAGFSLVTGGTDNHLILVDLTNKNVTGKVVARALDRAGIVLNYNAVPFDPRKPNDPSGIRLGAAAVTSRGFGPKEMETIGRWMSRVVEKPQDEQLLESIAAEVKSLCSSFPAPGLG